MCRFRKCVEELAWTLFFCLLTLMSFLTLMAGRACCQTPMPPAPVVKPIPASIVAKAGKLITIPVDGDWDLVAFVFSKKDFPADQAIIEPRKLTLTTGTNGVYSVVVVAIKDKTDKQSQVTITVTGGVDPGPVPTPPEPVDSLASLTAAVAKLTATVGKLDVSTSANFAQMAMRLTALEQIKPIPPPIPPDPPSPAPIPLAGFRVMIVYDPTSLTTSQEGIVFGKKVRDYLQAKCVAGTDGKTKDFRIYQTGLDTSAEVAWINNVIQRHPGQKAWMVVSDGKTGYDGVLPANVDEALVIMQKIGGQ